MSTLGERLRKAREARGWSTRRLEQETERLGRRVSHGYISQLENAGRYKANPSLSTIEVLARALGVSSAYLLQGDEKEEGDVLVLAEEAAPYLPRKPHRSRPPQQADTFAAWRPTGYDQLTPEQQREVDEFIAYIRHKYRKGGPHDRGRDRDKD